METKCSMCEEKPATLRVTVSEVKGNLLDFADICDVCAKEGLAALQLTTGRVPL